MRMMWVAPWGLLVTLSLAAQQKNDPSPEPPPDKPTGPVTARLVARQTKYTLDRMGLTILQARALDGPSRTIFDTFHVLPSDPQHPPAPAAIEDALRRTLAGDFDRVLPARRTQPRHLKHFRISPRIGIEALPDGGASLLTLVCTDRPGLLADVASVRVELYGSLGATGKGHGTDKGVILGLMGETPDTVDPDTIDEKLAGMRSAMLLTLLGKHTVPFAEREHIVFYRREAMAEHGYHLQYLLYTLALHRYLRRRLPDYDYDRDMGGSLYLFVRGVRPDWANAHLAGDDVPGVFFDKPSLDMVNALDRLFAAGDNAALAQALALDAPPAPLTADGEDA